MDRHTKTRDLFSGIMPVSGRRDLWRIKDKSVYPDGLLSMGVGGVVAVMSVLSRGKMGMGDGLLILAMGFCLKRGRIARNSLSGTSFMRNLCGTSAMYV